MEQPLTRLRANRKGMYDFLLSVKQPDGSFIMHKGGEVDVRCVPLGVANRSRQLTVFTSSQRLLLRTHRGNPPQHPHTRTRP